MTTMARRMIKGVLWLIAAYVALMTVAIVWVGWSLLIDTALPLRNLRASLVSYDPATRTALIRWEGVRVRFCPGVTFPKLRDGVVVDLEPGIITGAGSPEDRRQQALYPGITEYPISWQREIVIPPGVTGVARYVVTFSYACNLLQRLRPIMVTPPDVDIPVGPETNLSVTSPVAGNG